MSTKFRDFMREIEAEAEAEAEGPSAVAELEAFRTHFRLGLKLAEARARKKMTQKQVAKLAKIDQADLSKIERGDANPTFATLAAVASAVGCALALVPVTRAVSRKATEGGAKPRRGGASIAGAPPAPSRTPAKPARTSHSGRLRRRSAEDIAEILDSVVGLVKKHGEGLRAEQIRAELGKELTRVLKEAAARTLPPKAGTGRKSKVLRHEPEIAS